MLVYPSGRRIGHLGKTQAIPSWSDGKSAPLPAGSFLGTTYCEVSYCVSLWPNQLELLSSLLTLYFARTIILA